MSINNSTDKTGSSTSSSKRIRLITAIVVLLFAAAQIVFFSLFTVIGNFHSCSVIRRSVDTLVLESDDVDLFDGLSSLKNLKLVDARGIDLSTEEYDLLRETLPDCEILWSVPVGSERYDCKTTELVLTEDLSGEELLKLKYLDRLTSVDASSISSAYAELAVLREALPECRFTWKATIGDRTITDSDTKLVLDGMKFESLEQCISMLDCLNYFPSLQQVDMCGCGLESEQMAQLAERLPNIKLVWEIVVDGADGNLPRHWTIRTDALVFSTLIAYGSKMDEDNFRELLTYCTDLVALDLGHNEINDISLLANMKDLQVLILHDNNVRDISALANLKNLEYLEFSWNEYDDLSALCDLPNLKTLIMFGGEFDYDELLKLAQSSTPLELVCVGNLDDEYRRELSALKPGCNWFASYEEWHEIENYKSMKYAFKHWTEVVAYHSMGDIEYR